MRWDVSQIEGELIRLLEAYKTPDIVKSAELWAEELAARICRSSYEWDDNSLKAVLAFPGQLSVELQGSESKQEVSIYLHWVADGPSKHLKVTQWIRIVVPKVSNAFERGGWDVITSSVGSGTLDIRTTMPVNRIIRDPTKAAKTLEEAVGLVNEKGHL